MFLVVNRMNARTRVSSVHPGQLWLVRRPGDSPLLEQRLFHRNPSQAPLSPVRWLRRGAGSPRRYSSAAVTFTSVKCLSAVRGDILDLLCLLICQARRLGLVPPRARPGLMSGCPGCHCPEGRSCLLWKGNGSPMSVLGPGRRARGPAMLTLPLGDGTRASQVSWGPCKNPCEVSFC